MLVGSFVTVYLFIHVGEPTLVALNVVAEAMHDPGPAGSPDISDITLVSRVCRSYII